MGLFEVWRFHLWIEIDSYNNETLNDEGKATNRRYTMLLVTGAMVLKRWLKGKHSHTHSIKAIPSTYM